MKATDEEMKQEAILRLQLLHAPENSIEKLRGGSIPVTLFSAEMSGVEKIHVKALDGFSKSSAKTGYPFYITESWNVYDMISILFVEIDKNEWKRERQLAETQGCHRVYAYNLDCEKYTEIGDAFFSVEQGVLWRVG